MPNDHLLDNDYDAATSNGDFALGESTRQNKVLLMVCEPGEIRQYPEATVGIQKYIDDDSLGEMAIQIREKFEADLMTVKSVTISNTGTIETDADYNY